MMIIAKYNLIKPEKPGYYYYLYNGSARLVQIGYNLFSGAKLAMSDLTDNKSWQLVDDCSGDFIAADTEVFIVSTTDVILHCPKCKAQHIDAPEDRCKCGHTQAQHGNGDSTYGCLNCHVCGSYRQAWDNRPHSTHLCHTCGHLWKAADLNTNGVEQIKEWKYTQ